MKIVIGCDHAGFKLKESIKDYFAQKEGIRVEDYGTYSCESVDYPDYGAKVAKAIAMGEFERGILICKTGIGMSIIANRYNKVRAALCYDKESVLMSRKHNNANILVLPAYRFENSEDVFDLVKLWLETEFEGSRHQRRIEKLDSLI